MQPVLNVVTAAMYSALASHSRDCADLFLQIYCEPADPSLDAQISEANRFWRLQLGSMHISTMAVRENLVDGIGLNEWMRLFACEVAPVVAAFGLPRIDCTSRLSLVG